MTTARAFMRFPSDVGKPIRVIAYERLEWSADMTIVHNPSAIPVCFKFARQGESSRLVTVGAGETVTL